MRTATRKVTQENFMTWEDFIAYGLENCNANKDAEGKVPYSFEINGCGISYENNERYIIGTMTGNAEMTPKDVLIVRENEIYPCPLQVFEETYIEDEAGGWNLSAYPIQIVGRLNNVIRLDEEGPGGAYHQYIIEGVGPEGILGTVNFQKGPRNEKDSLHGVLDGDLLEIVRDRMIAFQNGPYACRENALILTHVEEALMWSAQRAHNRYQRGVLGTYQK